MPRIRGYTLVELSIGVAIVAVVLNSAVSGFANAVQSTRSSAARSSLFATLTTARTKAAVLDTDVVACPSSDGARCDRTHRWEGGWIVFADLNGTEEFEEGDVVLRREPPLGDGVSLVTSAGRTRLDFHPTGTNAGSNATFTFCDRRGPAKASAIAMSNSGTYRDVPPNRAAIATACGPG